MTCSRAYAWTKGTNLQRVNPISGPGASRPSHGYAFLTGAAYGLLVVLGGLLGLVGTFAHSMLNLVLSDDGGTFSRLPIGALLVIIATAAVCWLAGMGMRSRMGAALIGVPWLVVSYLFSMPKAEGDVVVAGDFAGGLYLYGGLILVAIAIMVVPPARPMPPSAPLLGGAG